MRLLFFVLLLLAFSQLASAGAMIFGGRSLFGMGRRSNFDGARREVPWFALVRQGHCGGVIIDERHVLTSAHCLELGDTDFLNRVNVEITNHRRVDALFEGDGKATIKPAYLTSQSAANDLAIITLDEAIPIDNVNIRPINLARTLPESGQEGLAVGQGKNSENSRFSDEIKVALNKVKQQCSREADVNVGVFCTIGLQDGERANTCSGDSGGPLIVDGMVAGILSRGNEDCGESQIDEAVYASISANREWIESFLSSAATPRGRQQSANVDNVAPQPRIQPGFDFSASAGDSSRLYAQRWFGDDVSNAAAAIERLNPWMRGQTLRGGEIVKIPTRTFD